MLQVFIQCIRYNAQLTHPKGCKEVRLSAVAPVLKRVTLFHYDARRQRTPLGIVKAM